MKAHQIQNGVVVNTIIVESLDFLPGLIEATTGGIGWAWDGATLTAPILPLKSPEVLQQEIVQAVQLRLDTFAQSRNYDSILSASTYATSAIPKFAQEGQSAVNARDATWATLYTVLGEVQSGKRPMPGGYTDIESELPVLNWPV